MSQPPGWLAQGRWRDVLLVSALGIAQAVATGIAAFATRDLFEALHKSTALPLLALLTLVTASISVIWLRVWSRLRGEKLGQSYAAAWRHVLFEQLMRQPLSTIENRRQGALGLRFVGDLSAMRNWLGEALPRILSGLFVLPGAALTLYWLDPALAMAAIPPVLFTLMIAFALAPKLGPAHASMRRNRANLAIAMMERVSMASELAQNGRARKELRNLGKDSEALARSAIDRQAASASLAGLPETGAALGAVGIFWTTSEMQLAASQAAAGLAVLGILLLPLRELASAWNRFCAWRIAVDKCRRILDLPGLDKLKVKADGAMPVIFDQVRFRGIALDLRIEPGKVVSIHGAPGVGKSSILRLAAGLEQPDQGRVHYGEEGCRPKTMHIGPSSPILQGSLRRALTLGANPRPDDQAILKTADAMGLAPLIARLSGLDGRIVEAGRNLSETERVKLHLCRAALAMPGLLLIDYPAEISQPWLQKALHRIIQSNQTTLMFSAHTTDQQCLADDWLDIEEFALRERTIPAHAPILLEAS